MEGNLFYLVRKLDFNKHWFEMLVLLVGALLIATTILADVLGLGGQAGYGLKQTILTLAGSGMALTGGLMLAARRYGWDPEIPTLAELNAYARGQWREIVSMVRGIHRLWIDVLIVVALAGVVGFASYQGGQLIDPVVFEQGTGSVWFESDIPDVFRTMTDRNAADHERVSVHPLFSIVAYPPVYVLNSVLGVERITAIKIFVAIVAILWITMLFVILRLIGCRRFDATLFSILGMTSASAMFWLVVPETFPFGSLSIMLALAIVILAQRRKLSQLWFVGASALTLGFTFTNWIVGIIATIVNHPLKRTLQITVNAFCIVVVVWMVEKALFPQATFPFFSPENRTRFILTPYSGGLLNILVAFVSHSMVMPAFVLVDRFSQYPNHWPIMITQSSLPGSGAYPWGIISIALWITILGFGIWAFFRVRQNTKFRIALGMMILAQLMLHLVYGEEIFLYAIHFVPLLVILAALSTLTRMRLVVLVLAGALALNMGINNGLQFIKATNMVNCLKQNDVRTTAIREKILTICGDSQQYDTADVSLISGLKELD